MAHDDIGMYTSAASRRNRRRKLVAAGVGGLFLILGVGGAVGYQLTDGNDPAPLGDGALQPLEVTSSTPVTASAAPSRSAAVNSPTSRSSVAAPTPSPYRSKTDAERRKAVQGLAASKAAELVKQPLPPVGGAVASAEDVTEITTGKPGNTLKVVSAAQDLTGYRELGWIADEGEAVGNARCTSTIRLSNTAEARERPTLLLCWRTSPTKSVYTVAVKTGGRPSKAASVTAIDQQWAKLS